MSLIRIRFNQLSLGAGWVYTRSTWFRISSFLPRAAFNRWRVVISFLGFVYPSLCAFISTICPSMAFQPRRHLEPLLLPPPFFFLVLLSVFSVFIFSVDAFIFFFNIHFVVCMWTTSVLQNWGWMILGVLSGFGGVTLFVFIIVAVVVCVCVTVVPGGT